MTDDINKKIKKAYSDITPDIFDSIRSQCNEKKGSAVIMTRNKHNNFKKFVSIAAAIILVVAGIGVFGVYQNNNAVKSVVSLDVNPSIEINLNKNEKVLDVIPLNTDAEKIIGTMDFKNSDLTVTINALVGSMLRNGYLTDIANSILVTVDGDDHTRNEDIQKKLIDEINAILGGNNIKGAILTQETDLTDEISLLAEKYGISIGKAQLAHKLSDELANHTADELAQLSINELNILAEKSENVNSNGDASKKAYIGSEKALELALNRANVTLTNSESAKIELDSDDGVMVYEIEFTVPPYEYDVEVNALNGEIVKFEKDGDDIDNDVNILRDDIVNNVTSQNDTTVHTMVQNTAPVSTTAKAVIYLPAAKIKTIALEKIGAKESDVTRYRAEFDMDDGVATYEVSVDTSEYEYEIEVNAVTGAILSFDKERIEVDDIYDDDDDDDKEHINKPTKPETTTKATSKDTIISKDDAKAVAVSHAGVKASEITEYSCEYDNDEGVKVYEIEFRHNGYEYSYEINAETGKIIDSEKDTD